MAVAVTEAFKLLICCGVELRACMEEAERDEEPLTKLARQRAKELVESALPMLLPAGMFVMQQVTPGCPRVHKIGLCCWLPYMASTAPTCKLTSV